MPHQIQWKMCILFRYENLRSLVLTHWGRVMHICIGKLTIIGSDNGLSSGRRQAIIWTNAGILLIGPSGTNLSEILIAIQTFSFRKMHLKISSAKWRPFCFGLNALKELVSILKQLQVSHIGRWSAAIGYCPYLCMSLSMMIMNCHKLLLMIGIYWNIMAL